VFSQDQFLHWCRKLDLSERAEGLVRQIRSAAPARLVRSGRGNVSGRYPSRKMGVTIQFESHKNELPHIQTLEHDSEVIEFYDQPPPIKIEYRSAAGRHLGVLHTPDFFVLRETSAGWEECKMEEELDRLAEKSPDRYRRDGNGQWKCPPGENYAEQFNFYYRLVSSAGIIWIWQRNVTFLDDYLRADTPAVGAAAGEAARLLLSRHPGLTLEELFGQTAGSVSRDDWFRMIADGDVYVDLHAASLTDDRQVRVFLDREIAIAHSHLVLPSPPSTSPTSRTVSLAAGVPVQWDGRNWMIVNVGDAMISLLGVDHSFTELPVAAFEKLIGEGRITAVMNDPAPALSL
jgi:hypothetical protein